MRVRANILLEIKHDEFFMPVDGNPTHEITDMLHELLANLDGINILKLQVKRTGVPKYATHE